MGEARVPIEIIDDIVYHLCGDAVTLARCCLVSRAFSIPSQKALITVISFDTTMYSSALTSSPNHPYDESQCDATHHRWNKLCASLFNDTQKILYIEELWLNGTNWAVTEPTFSALLACLVQSQTLRVLSLAFSLGTQEGWAVLPPALSEPLHALFRSPRLHTLRIHMPDRCACTIPARVFAGVSPSLKRLYVGGESIFSIITGGWCSHQDVVQPEMPVTQKHIKLEVIEIGCLNMLQFRDLLVSPYNPYDLSAVKTVVIRAWADPIGLSEIIRMMKTSIETLVWFHPQARSGFFVEATKLYLLKSLRSVIFIVSESDQVDSALKLLTGRGALPESLKEIHIYIDDQLGHLRSDAVQSRIDQNLANALTIYGSRDVKIINVRRVRMLNDRAIAMMKKYFPRLSKAARFSVSEEDLEDFEQKMMTMTKVCG